MQHVLGRLFCAASIAVAALAVPAMVIPADAAQVCCCCKQKPRPPAVRVDRTGHDPAWMQSQGFQTCSQVRASCYRGAKKPGHGLAYASVCEDRYDRCLRTGTWSTTNTGSVSGLERR